MEPDVRLIREEALLRLVPVSHSTLFRWERLSRNTFVGVRVEQALHLTA